MSTTPISKQPINRVKDSSFDLNGLFGPSKTHQSLNSDNNIYSTPDELVLPSFFKDSFENENDEKRETSSIVLNTGYGTMKITKMTVEEEIEKVVKDMKKKQIAYIYYSSIWTLSAVALCFFVTAGISGLLGPISSWVGSAFAIVGIAGSVTDWKGWSKKNAQSFN